MTVANLRLFGKPELHTANKYQPLERKQAAFLAYLAIEGAQSRSKLAGLLWANSTEATARNNLAQTLKRIKTAFGEIIEANGELRLQNVKADAAELEKQFFLGDFENVATQTQVFLQDLDFEDCPDLTEWVFAKRLRFEDLCIEACAHFAEQLAQTDLQAALHWAETYRQRRPESEAGYQRLMRLYHAIGDNGRMHQSFKQCQIMLEQEFAVQPSATTLALLEQLQHQIPKTAAPPLEPQGFGSRCQKPEISS